MKRREALTLATMWMDLETTMLSERNGQRKTHVWDSLDGKCPEQANTQRDLMVAGGGGEGGRPAEGDGASFGMMECSGISWQ